MNGAEQKAFTIVRRRKYQAEQKAEAALKRLREDKIFSEIESERDSVSFESARLAAQNKDNGHLKERINILNTKLEARIKELKMTPGNIRPDYFCKLCGDTGMNGADNCQCVNKLIYGILKDEGGVTETDIDDFSDISLDIIDPEKKRRYSKCYEYLDNYSKEFPDPKVKILGLTGAVGTGKTFALSVLANRLMKNGFSVYMINAQKLNRLFLNYHLAPLEKKEELFEPLITVDLLIIDDLGAESIYNNVTVNYLYALLSERYDKPIALSTNLNLQQIEERYGQRVFSRLSDKSRCAYMYLEGEDLRLK